MYRQCVLRKDGRETTSWVPVSIANKGNVVKIKMPGGEWDNGWTISEIRHAFVKNGDQVELLENTYRYIRDVSDV